MHSWIVEMPEQNIWWDYWYFHLPNYVLAAVFYTMFGRFILSFILPPDSPNYIYRWFRRLTDPALVAVGWITPRAVNVRYLPLVGAFWIGMLRLAWFLMLASMGLAPSVAGLAAP
ncbi:MAG: hypothetical protein K0S54_176 [Alphaproteobacteria bacterium]|nr:hypothetical protein [Alphaproteobacteria bacterium]